MRGRSGDAEALAGEVVAAIPFRAENRGAGTGIARATQSADGVVRGTDAVCTDHALAYAERRVATGALLAGRHRTGIARGAIGIDKTFDRGAIATQAGLPGAASGIVAAIAGHTGDSARAVVTAHRAIVAIVLVTESRFAPDIAGARVGHAIGQSAARSRTTGDADVAVGASTAALFTGATTQLAIRARAELRNRAAQIFTVAMPGATTLAAAFGITGTGRIEMRMAAMIAAEFAPFGHGLIRRNIAATVFGRAGPGADITLAACLGRGVETPASVIYQRRDTDPIGAGLGLRLIHRQPIRGRSRFGWFVQWNG